MKKLTTVALAGALAVAGVAHASMSRIAGLGEGSQFISDVQDIWTLPQVVASNPNATYLEFGQFDANGQNQNNLNDSVEGQGWGGAHMKLGAGVLGIWGNRPFHLLSNIAYYADGNNYFGGVFNDLDRPDQGVSTGQYPHSYWYTPDHNIDILYAWDVNDKLALGIGLNRGNSTRENETDQLANGTTNIYSRTDTDYGISLGADLKELGAINLLQMGLQYTFGNGLNEYKVNNVDNKYDHNYSELDIRVAGEIKGDKDSFQRFNVTLGTQGLDSKEDFAVAPPSNDFTEAKFNSFNYGLGYAMGMQSEKGIGLGGLTINGILFGEDAPNLNSDATNQSTWQRFNIKFVTSGEASLKDWLKARAGFSTTVFGVDNYQYKYSSGAGTETDGYSQENNDGNGDTQITLGLSFLVGDITIDGALNQDILFNGVYAVNGISSQLFSQVSATWAWGAGKE